eukprot:1144346-Rhodomonas_salina.1
MRHHSQAFTMFAQICSSTPHSSSPNPSCPWKTVAFCQRKRGIPTAAFSKYIVSLQNHPNLPGITTHQHKFRYPHTACISTRFGITHIIISAHASVSHTLLEYRTKHRNDLPRARLTFQSGCGLSRRLARGKLSAGTPRAAESRGAPRTRPCGSSTMQTRWKASMRQRSPRMRLTKNRTTKQ